MRRSNFALRLQPSLMEEVRKAAEMEGVALNQLINVAVAEKVSALRTEQYFRERSLRANRTETMQILARAGRDNEPMSGDEVVEDENDVTRKTKKKQPAESRKHRQRANSQAKKVRG
jgi:HicB family